MPGWRACFALSGRGADNWLSCVAAEVVKGRDLREMLVVEGNGTNIARLLGEGNREMKVVNATLWK